MKNTIVIGVLVFFIFGCADAGKKTAVGAGVGAAAGALIGGALGSRTGDTGKGALIGAGMGAALGGAIGLKMDKQAKELERVAETKRTENGIITKLKGDILFESNQADLKDDAKAKINQISDILKKYPENRITVVGHTDNTGNKADNQVLSEQRAKAVMLQMSERGVPDNNIKVLGMGDAQPSVENKSATSRAQNRRVELKITMQE